MKRQALTDALKYFDNFINYTFGELDIVSLSYAVTHRGELLHARAFGEARSGETPATSKTRYRVASNSKMFTAAAVLQLQEKGMLYLDDPAAKYLPWLSGHKDTRWSQVTIRQLLSHTAGVSRDSSQSGYWSLQREFPSKNELQDIVLRDDLVFDENTCMKYSNYGYGVVGAVIEAASGISYAEYVTTHILRPLGLTHTTMEYDDTYEVEAAAGYTLMTPGVRRHLPIAPINTKALAASTGCMSTPSDLALFLAQVFSEKSTVLSPASVRELQRIHTKAQYGEEFDRFYGLGLEIGEYDNKAIIGHGGGFPGQLTHTLMVPSDHLSMSVAINTNGLSPAKLTKSLLSTLYWFDRNYAEDPVHDISKFTFRAGHLWGASDYVGYGNSLVCIPTRLPIDFSYAEQLEYLDDSTVKVADTSSYMSPGETVSYVFNRDGSVKWLKNAGTIIKSAQVRDEEWSNILEIKVDKS